MRRGYVQYENKEPVAASMRHDITAYIKQKWTEFPIFNPSMKVHDLMWYQHDMGITPAERAKRGDWPADPAGRLHKYASCCKELYFSDTEMLMFACWMYETAQIPICFRIWRCTGRDGANAELISRVPDPGIMRLNGIESAVVVDMDHNGVVDSPGAHYKVLEYASLEGLTTVRRDKRKLGNNAS